MLCECNAKDEDSFNRLEELTVAKRQKASDWFFHFMKQCRNGGQCDEMYNLAHGFPTMYTGSWLPVPSTSHAYTLLCDKPECYELCEKPGQSIEKIVLPGATLSRRNAMRAASTGNVDVVPGSKTQTQGMSRNLSRMLRTCTLSTTHGIMHCYFEPYESQPRTNAS